MPNAQGGVTTVYSDHTFIVTNGAGQDVTANFMPPQSQTPLQSAAQAVGDAVSNLPSTLAQAGKNAANAASGVLTPIAIIAVVGLVAYLMLGRGKR